MEIDFDPRLQSLPKIQKKKDRQGKRNAFQEALENEEGMKNGPGEREEIATTIAGSPKKAQKPRNDDGKGLKVDLLA